MSIYTQEQYDRIMHRDRPRTPTRDPLEGIDMHLALALATNDPHPMTPQMVERGRAYLAKHFPHFKTDYTPPVLRSSPPTVVR